MNEYKRDVTKYKNHIVFDNLDHYHKYPMSKLNIGVNYLISIAIENIYIDFNIKIGEQNSLVALFNSAIPNSKKNLTFPFFTGAGITSGLKSTKIYFCDPILSLFKDRKVFWYLGTKKIPVQEIIYLIIKKIYEELGIKKILFWGSSGGGFPAIYYSYFFENSLALVNAPTTTLLDHHDVNIMDELRKLVWDRLEDKIDGILDFSELVQNNKVLILQNSRDHIFINHHVTPYARIHNIDFNRSSIFSENCKIICEDWGRGHLVAPKYIISNLLRLYEYSDDPFLEGYKEQRLKTIVNIAVSVAKIGEWIQVKVFNVFEDASYALYLCDNDKIVEKIMYKNNSLFCIPNMYKNGVYTFKVFVRFKVDNFILIYDTVEFKL